jgi:hypothetical protein
MKRPIRGAAEEDTFTPWRRVYCYLARPGVTSKIKRGYRRGERHQAKAEIRREVAA